MRVGAPNPELWSVINFYGAIPMVPTQIKLDASAAYSESSDTPADPTTPA